MRLINDEIFHHPWFLDLSANAKLTYLYLFLRCDYAGFLMVRLGLFSSDLKLSEGEVSVSLEQLQEANLIVISNRMVLVLGAWRSRTKDENVKLPQANKTTGKTANTLFNNNAHTGIYKQLHEYAQYFDYEVIQQEFKPFLDLRPLDKVRGLQGASKGDHINTINNSDINSYSNPSLVKGQKRENEMVWADEMNDCDICETSYGNPCKHKELCQRESYLEEDSPKS